MPQQKQLILQETFEACSIAMQDLTGHAGDLDSVGFRSDSDDLREIVGRIEQFIIDLRKRHS